MPVLPYSYYSNYYLVTINQSSGINLNDALNTPLPNLLGNLIASKFTVKIENSTESKLMIQGRPGIAVKESNPLIYTYQIDFPIILTYNGLSNDYAIFHTFLINAINNQYQNLWNGSNGGSAFIESYKMNFGESECVFSVTIISDSKLSIDAQLFSNTIYNITYGRTMRYYDIATDIRVLDANNNIVYIIGPEDKIFIRDADFTIKFEYETKQLMNKKNADNFPSLFFLLKNYNVEQNFTIAGIEQNLIPAIFSGGYYNVYDFQSTIYLPVGEYWAGYWINFNLPGYLKSETLNVSANNLVDTKLEFSLYGTESYTQGSTLISTSI